VPTFRARVVRFALRHSIGRRLRSGVVSVAELRKLDDLMIRSQRLPRGTTVAPLAVGTLPAESVRGPGAREDVTVLYFHGGAFVAGSPATHRELAARISGAVGGSVLLPQYRLAPEHPFPAAVDDGTAAYRWLLERGSSPGSLFMGGDSSGGGLVLQTLLVLRDEGLPLPRAAFFLSPVTDWCQLDGESYTTHASLDPMVSPAQCRHTASLYAGSQAADSPLLRPAEMDLTGLPPMWIHVGDHEVLLSDAQRLADRASDAGVDVHFRVWPGMWHVFQAAARFVPEARESLEDLASFLRGRREG